jgi:hypothetical protein
MSWVLGLGVGERKKKRKKERKWQRKTNQVKGTRGCATVLYCTILGMLFTSIFYPDLI